MKVSVTGAIVVAAVAACLATAQGQQAPPAGPSSAALSVADFLPKDHVTDGSVSYQTHLQKALDVAAGKSLVFPPMVYRLDETGLTLRSGTTLWLYGAVFKMDEKATKDGQTFVGKDVAGLQIFGGTIVGRNDVWAEGVNVRGLHLMGSCRDIRIRDMTMRDLSSNGIGVFGDPKDLARDVWVTDCVIDNCCNRYGDYLSAKPGPEKGS